MKKMISVMLVLALLFSLAACDKQTSPALSQSNAKNEPEQSDIKEEKNELLITSTNNTEDPMESPEIKEKPTNSSGYSYSIDLESITTLDELEKRIDEDITNLIDSLRVQWGTLSSEIDTYEKYSNNTERVSEYYQQIINDTEQMCIMLKEYGAVYVRMILDSNMTIKNMYQAVDGIKESLYDKACDTIYNEIYEGILNEMFDYFYKGILENKEENVDYGEWYNIYSEEYEQWYDTSSNVYDLYYDTSSDIYSLYYDLSSRLYSEDLDRAEKVYEKYLQRIAKDKGLDIGNTASNGSLDTSVHTTESLTELEGMVIEQVSECVQALKDEWERLSTDIDTFEKYNNNIDTIEDFHSHVSDSASQILVMICEYGVRYAELIMQSDSSTKEKYKDFEGFKDCIYEDACEIVKDEIYDDLLEEVKDYYYEGVIKKAKDSVPYSEWASARSDAYSWWSATRSDVYSDWSTVRSDLYSFFSNIRSKLFSDDVEGASKKLNDFVKKIEKMK